MLESERMLDTTQTLIESANMCADLLWTAPVEDIEFIRKRPQPPRIPDIKPEKSDKKQYIQIPRDERFQDL